MSLKHDIYMRFFASEWGIAWRKAKEGALFFERNRASFNPVPNNDEYWFADPLPFVYGGKLYLFAEGYSRKKKKGIIGYFDFSEKSFMNFVPVIERPYHLSFPFIFEIDGSIYMMPETRGNRTVELYKAIRFPEIWSEPVEILSDVNVADSIVAETKRGLLLITHTEDDPPSVEIYSFDSDCFGLSLLEKKQDFNKLGRGAGRIFRYKDAVYRPCQNCINRYGGSLILKRIPDSISYEEIEEIEVLPENISLITRKKIKGVHTYSYCEGYEFIDVLYCKATDFILTAYQRLKKGKRRNINR